jgi:hypothetical protein
MIYEPLEEIELERKCLLETSSKALQALFRLVREDETNVFAGSGSPAEHGGGSDFCLFEQAFA